MTDRRIPPAGDPFIGASFAGQREVPDHEAKPSEADGDEAPHACYEGIVFIGHMVDDYMGGEVEIFWPVPCRRCGREGS